MRDNRAQNRLLIELVDPSKGDPSPCPLAPLSPQSITSIGDITDLAKLEAQTRSRATRNPNHPDLKDDGEIGDLNAPMRPSPSSIEIEMSPEEAHLLTLVKNKPIEALRAASSDGPDGRVIRDLFIVTYLGSTNPDHAGFKRQAEIFARDKDLPNTIHHSRAEPGIIGATRPRGIGSRVMDPDETSFDRAIREHEDGKNS